MADINLALGKTTQASNYVMPYASSKAVDGNCSTPTSRWLGNVPGWISVDLGAPYLVYRWCVRHMPSAGWVAPDYVMSDFKLQGSNDNTNWTDIDTVTNNTTNPTDRIITGVSFRYFRVYVTKGLRTNNKLASLMELEIYKAPKSSYLLGLTVSSGALSPAFAKNTFVYAAPSVAYGTGSITVAATTEDAAAALKINGIATTNGQPQTVNLNYGANVVQTAATASDSSSTTIYTVNAIRTSPYLTGLTLSGGNLSGGFGQNTYAYTTSVGNEVGSITVTPTAQDPSARITVNGAVVNSGQPSGAIPLNEGANIIPIVVTPTVGTAQTYTVTVYRKSTLYLSNLLLKNGVTNVAANPVFDGAILDYTASVPSTAANITISPTLATGVTATMTINGNSVVSGGRVTIGVISGVNTISVVLSSSTSPVKTNTYTVKVTKP